MRNQMEMSLESRISMIFTEIFVRGPESLFKQGLARPCGGANLLRAAKNTKKSKGNAFSGETASNSPLARSHNIFRNSRSSFLFWFTANTGAFLCDRRHALAALQLVNQTPAAQEDAVAAGETRNCVL